MYMRGKTPIKEGATLPGKSHHYFFQTHSNSDKGHVSNQTLRRGQERKSLCVCVECVGRCQARRLGGNKHDKTISQRKVGRNSRHLKRDDTWGNIHKAYSHCCAFHLNSGEFVYSNWLLEQVITLPLFRGGQVPALALQRHRSVLL